MNVLFVCARNRLRSPTAEAVFADWPGIRNASAGLAPDAECVLDASLVGWADLIVVMERVHCTRLQQRFGAQLHGNRVACLGIPDRYGFMEPAWVERLQRSVPPLLRGLRP